MKICYPEIDFKFTLNGSCDACGKRYSPERTNVLGDIVPAGLCPIAYYSIIPYWVSFKENAWFRWRRSKNDVVCQCPKPEGVVFLVKKTGSGKTVEVEAEVVSSGDGSCPCRHRAGQVFQIKNELLCPALFPSFWTQAQNLKTAGAATVALNCAVSAAAISLGKKL